MKLSEITQQKKVFLGLFLSSILISGVDINSVNASEITDAISKGKATVDIRLRSEIVDQDGKDDKAHASTLRAKIGYKTSAFKGLSGFAEFENTTALIDDYSLPGAGGDYPVVADPEGSEVNQFYLNYQAPVQSFVRFGRQKIIFDSARFVGNVGWRQNEQTYDGLFLSSKAIPNSEIRYAYLNNINKIVGTSEEMETHLINLKYNMGNILTINPYAYLLDFDNSGDSKTLGVNVSGKYPVTKNMKALYKLEYAMAGDYADNDSGKSPTYYAIELGGVISGITAKLGYEVLGSDEGSSFQTPLATKHKFNGWADKFLSTPANGLVDTYITVVGKLMKTKLLASFHVYSAEEGSDSYGKEINLLAAKKFGKIYSVGVKYANYMADDFSVDTQKLWVWGGIKF